MASDDVTLDFQRPARIGLDEAVLCEGKTPEQLQTILERGRTRGVPLLLTRLSLSQREGLPPGLDYDPVSRTAFAGAVKPPVGPPRVAVVAAGTSDAFVTLEVARTLAFHGAPCTLVQDVGVAGLWRLLEKVELIQRHPVVVAVAGLDAALPTVLGGLVGSVLIAVPTSTGYGVAEGGRAALQAILASCAPGVVALNIDNGYGAACAALRVLRALDGLTPPRSAPAPGGAGPG
jgi:NCAIR mutase (PurE)-related protein